MDSDVKCFVSGALAAILRAAKFTGLAPIQFEKQGNGWWISLSKRYILISLFTITIINFVLIWVVISLFQIKSDTSRNMCVMDLVLTIVSMQMLVFSTPRHMKCLIVSLNIVKKINAEVNIHHWSTPWTRKQIVFLVIWGTFSVMVILVNYLTQLYLNSLTDNDYIKTWTNVMYSMKVLINLINLLCGAQFAFLVLHVQTSFEAINNCLKSLLQDSFMISRYTSKTVRRVESAYVSACNTVISVNNSYGLMQMVLLAILFLHIIITFYHSTLSFVLVQDPSAGNILHIFKFAQSIWCSYGVLSLILFVEPCHSTRVEAKRTGDLLSQLMIRTPLRDVSSDLVALEIHQFYWQLALSSVSYRPLAVATMSRCLVLTILGSVITYLVILVDTKKSPL